MVLLKLALLVGFIRVTIEDIGTEPAIWSFFYGPGVLELAAVVSQDHLEILFEGVERNLLRKFIDGIYNAFLGASLKEQAEHEVGIAEKQCQDAFALSVASHYGIHLNDLIIRMVLHEE